MTGESQKTRQFTGGVDHDDLRGCIGWGSDMIITKDFIFLHLPKTGGTFVSQALHRAYGTKITWWNASSSKLLGRHRFRTRYGDLIHLPQAHIRRVDLPAQWAALPILSCHRLPFDRYVSIYEFGWWKRPERKETYHRRVVDFDTRFPNFPELSFRDFLELQHEAFMPNAWQGMADAERPGLNTWQFIRQFAANPYGMVKRNRHDRAAILRISQPITFLRTSHLNKDLHRFLVGVGLEAEDVDFIKKMKPVLPHGIGRGSAQAWEGYYDQGLRDLITQKDAGLLELSKVLDTVGLTEHPFDPV